MSGASLEAQLDLCNSLYGDSMGTVWDRMAHTHEIAPYVWPYGDFRMNCGIRIRQYGTRSLHTILADLSEHDSPGDLAHQYYMRAGINPGQQAASSWCACGMLGPFIFRSTASLVCLSVCTVAFRVQCVSPHNASRVVCSSMQCTWLVSVFRDFTKYSCMCSEAYVPCGCKIKIK
jgi:hypothetical protein